ncbi:ATP-dependent RNA helicase [Chrysochromulina tobinii]|uniref:ATP-dependent RNA helicase n=1 Tax=Chrysochromulina tobinii TaxID=1460289 RepID=A0A0M0JNT1_9EUKA|nr:ATP-dependent RNA helicase [Chrysochromulina tobinii]|eukprot:KOO28249.1 ATP-dependent RNA helicase [Chrysochromulina sp. CCMP291]
MRLIQTVLAVRADTPHMVVGIDSKGFNLRVLRHLSSARRSRTPSATDDKQPTPILVQYVAPSAWAFADAPQRAARLAETVLQDSERHRAYAHSRLAIACCGTVNVELARARVPQEAALARAFAGESLLLHAETGSGKSLAFLLPTLARLGLAGLVDVPAELTQAKVLIITPTRELGVQLANEAALVLPAAGAVQIVAIGATPPAAALLGASVITCTAPELLALLRSEGEGVAGVVDAVLSQVRVLIMDELDMLLPVSSTYGINAAKRKKTENKKGSEVSPAEELVRLVLEASSAADLQVLAASATVSRPTRLKLARVLRRDPLGRWYDAPPEMVRSTELEQLDLSTVPRAVVIPREISHYYVRLDASVKLRRILPKAAARPVSKRRQTLKQKRTAKLAAQKATRGQPAEGDIHPLFTSLEAAHSALDPSSALVFLCRSSGLTVRRAARELRELGLPALALHEAIGLEHSTDELGSWGTAEGAEGAESATSRTRATRSTAESVTSGTLATRTTAEVDTSSALLSRHRAISSAFSSRVSPGADGTGAAAASSTVPSALVERRDERTPLLITFEDMARGLHFEAVETVFILGMPDSPATYLHLAGRTGRQGRKGSVVTVCPGAAFEQLLSWSQRLGGIRFEELAADEAADEAADDEAADDEAAEEEDSSP